MAGVYGDYFLDVAFKASRLALEIDGWEFHRDRFESDHRKHADLASSGWTVVPITWRMLTDGGLFVDLVRRALAMARHRG